MVPQPPISTPPDTHFPYPTHVQSAIISQRAQGRQHDEMTSDFKVLAQTVAKARTAKAIGAKHREATTGRHERTNLIAKQFDIVGGHHNGPAGDRKSTRLNSSH